VFQPWSISEGKIWIGVKSAIRASHSNCGMVFNVCGMVFNSSLSAFDRHFDNICECMGAYSCEKFEFLRCERFDEVSLYSYEFAALDV
jgi:hypothetical protein